MTELLIPATGAGLIVGFRHALEADHVAAVATLATGEKGWNRAAILGVIWGVGHTLSIAAIAVLLIVLGIRISENFFSVAEAGVALLLILLGVWTIAKEMRDKNGLHTYTHSHDIRSNSGALGFGVIHGLAGSGAVVALLVATSNNLTTQMSYLLAFGIGTVAGMTIASLITGAAAGLFSVRSATALKVLRIVAGLLSIVVGVVLGREVLGW